MVRVLWSFIAKISYSETELRRKLKDTTDARLLIEQLGTPPLQNVSEIKEVLLIAEKGDCLTPYQLERVEKLLVAICAAYGEMAVKNYIFQNTESNIKKKSVTKITKAKTEKNNRELATKYRIGDLETVENRKKRHGIKLFIWNRSRAEFKAATPRLPDGKRIV